MIVSSGVHKDSGRIRRFRHTVALEPALVELMRLYDRLGGALEQADGELEAQIERTLGERGLARERVQEHLQRLLRARDLHRYVMEDADLVTLKLRVCEHVLHHRGLPERWAAIREVLLQQLERICQPPLPGLAGNLELYKRALSEKSGRLGKLLRAVALFNLDRAEEPLPSNLVLRFRRGSFPNHWCELAGEQGRPANLHALLAWAPAQALCRWEFLATDLAHALFRRVQEATGAALRRVEGWRAEAPPAAPETVYGRLDTDPGDERARQLELFPLDAGTLTAGLLRRVQRRLGPDGVRLLAALCGRMQEAAPGVPLELTLPALAAESGLGDLSARGLRTRTQRLMRVIGDLEQVELTRVRAGGSGSQARTTRLLTVLGRSGHWTTDARTAGDGEPDTAWQVLLDPWAQETLGATFRDLPPLLLEYAGKDHPCLIPLYTWLRRGWGEEVQRVPLVRTARSLLDEAGVWVSETGRYRAIEALKRDLERMREEGWLGAWRLLRAESRDAMEDRYRLSPPGVGPLTAQPGGAPVREDGWEALTGA